MGSITTKQSAADTDRHVAEVAILWSDTILDVTQLGLGTQEQRTFTVGEETDCDSWIEPDFIGGLSKSTLVEASDAQVIVHLPANAAVKLERPEVTITDRAELLAAGLAQSTGTGADLTVEEGWAVEVTLGEITFRVRRTQPGHVDKSLPPIDWSALKVTGASLLVHGVFLALVFAIPPDPSSISLNGATSGNRFVSYLVAPPEVHAPEVPDFMAPDRQVTEDPPPPEAGSAHAGEGGAMGHREAPRNDNHYAIRNRGGDQVQLGAEERRDLVINSGILSVLRANAPTSPFSTTGPNGLDAEDALGALLGSAPGASFGYGGLAVSGTGRGGNGRADSISLGMLNTIGRFASRNRDDQGSNRALLHRNGRQSVGPTVRHGVVAVNGTLPRSAIRRQIRLRRNQIAHCYQSQLNGNPDLAGRVTITFIIDAQGRVITSTVSSNTVGSPEVGQCVSQVIRRISFPAPGSGVVRVNYPFTFVASH